MSYCPSCGSENVDGVKFCQACGAAQVASPVIEPAQQGNVVAPSPARVPSSGSTLKIALIGLAILVVAIVGYVAFFKPMSVDAYEAAVEEHFEEFIDTEWPIYDWAYSRDEDDVAEGDRWKAARDRQLAEFKEQEQELKALSSLRPPKKYRDEHEDISVWAEANINAYDRYREVIKAAEGGEVDRLIRDLEDIDVDWWDEWEREQSRAYNAVEDVIGTRAYERLWD